MKNIRILPTSKSSIVYKNLLTDKLFILENSFMDVSECNREYQNIYITNSDEIKEGDWMYYKHFGEDIVCKYDTMNGQNTNVNEHKPFYQKIILTTDQDLINDGVQAIDDEFLEWFVKNPSCEFVDVKKESHIEIEEVSYEGDFQNVEYISYKIIIPQEEPKQDLRKYPLTPDECFKQETLEEFIFKVPFDYNIKPKEVIDMCMKEQENIILTWRLGYFIDMINALPDDTEKNRILKSVFDNRDGELLLESYKSMKSHYEE
jgi:hypothetical protein